ncbi:MAG: hypothetical protein KatS3mg109_0061 [Pirellulaceae bacterium]|nr:MAG: hypothetical protein KatS3mg109_0061 [Pirellulaceae bacterium]
MTGMVKIFSPGDWKDSPDVGDHQIKIASTGLGAEDKRQARKFASDELLNWLEKIETHPDCVYVHKIAMSGSHRYGPNRWGDGFREEVLDRDCGTFETHAKAYRHHRSGKGMPYYGRPKLARFRKDLGVVELITEYYGTDKVASANGGHVADREIDSLIKLGHIPVSMGSHVPGDRCVICGHWAKSRAEHCLPKSEGGTCELFGCRHGMLKIASDGRQQFVDNPINCFFDISMVKVGADPVANGVLLPVGMGEGLSQAKLASYCEKLAEYVPDEVKKVTVGWSNEQRSAYHLAGFFSDIEVKLASLPSEAFDEIDLGLASHRTEMGISGLFSSSHAVRRSTIAGLAEAREFPSFEQYAKQAGLTDAQIEELRPVVAMSFSTIRARGLLPNMISGSDFRGPVLHYYKPTKLAGLPTGNEIELSKVARRGLELQASGFEREGVKTAGIAAEIPGVVWDYASAKLAWFRHIDADPWLALAMIRKEFSKVGEKK